MTTPSSSGPSGFDPDERSSFAPISGDADARDPMTDTTDGVVGGLSGEDESRRGAGGKVAAWTIAGVAVLLGGLYAAGIVLAEDKVPLNTSVNGVEIGGLQPAEAEQRLREGLARSARTEIGVQVGAQRFTVDPEQAGMSLDAGATVAEAGGRRGLSPVRLWQYWFGGGAVEPQVAFDEPAFEAAMAELGEGVDAQPVDGAIRFVPVEGPRGVRAEVTTPEMGEGVDVDQARARLSAAFTTAGPVELATVELEPDITQTDVDAAMSDFVEPALSGPVRFVLGDQPVLVRPAAYTRAITLEPQDGELVPTIDEQRLTQALRPAMRQLGREPQDASFDFRNGRPVLVPARTGVTYDPAEVRDNLLELVTRPKGERELEIEATVARPDLTTPEARKLGVKEQVSTFTTNFPYAEYRNINLSRAAEKIDGTLLQPGETFSMNDIVGERTAENGFAKGFIIADGIFKEDFGGGVSQIATTTFNAAFFAGLEDVEHKPHSVYIDRYPVGREATVVWGALDLRFKNDTPYGIYIKADVTKSTPSSQGSATVSMWSTKYWDITTSESERYNFAAHGSRTITGEECSPAAGTDGFSIDVFRYFARAGSGNVERTEKFHTDYNASDEVICR